MRSTKGITVLSLFDGSCCGRLALKRAGIKVAKYYASEIDKYAISVTRYNFPEVIHLGDVRNIKGKVLPKIDLLIGGSPCTGFSTAGKGLNFEDPQSILFFEYVRLLKECKPRWFMLENVKMKKEWASIISEYLGVGFIEINAALLLAQHRKRFYWTNLKGIKQPKDKGIMLKDIIFDDAKLGSAGTIMLSNLYRGFNKKTAHLHTDKSATVRPNNGGGHIPSVITAVCGRLGDKDKKIYLKDVVEVGKCVFKVGRVVSRRLDKRTGKRADHDIKIKPRAIVEVRSDNKSGCLTSVQKDNLVLSVKELKYMNRKVKGGRSHFDFKHHSDVKNEKSSAVVANFFKGVPYNVLKDWNCIRKLHPIECERLQGMPDRFTEKGINEKGEEVNISNTRRYKAVGNAWAVDVIVHIFKYLKKEIKNGKINK